MGRTLSFLVEIIAWKTVEISRRIYTPVIKRIDKSERMDQIVRVGVNENDWMDSSKSVILSLSEWVTKLLPGRLSPQKMVPTWGMQIGPNIWIQTDFLGQLEVHKAWFYDRRDFYIINYSLWIFRPLRDLLQTQFTIKFCIRDLVGHPVTIVKCKDPAL